MIHVHSFLTENQCCFFLSSTIYLFLFDCLPNLVASDFCDNKEPHSLRNEHILILNTSVFAKGNMGQRKYQSLVKRCLPVGTWATCLYSVGNISHTWHIHVCTYTSEYYCIHIHIRLHTLTSPNLNRLNSSRDFSKCLGKPITYLIFGGNKPDAKAVVSNTLSNKVIIASMKH
jgi:hypothetical protein